MTLWEMPTFIGKWNITDIAFHRHLPCIPLRFLFAGCLLLSPNSICLFQNSYYINCTYLHSTIPYSTLESFFVFYFRFICILLFTFHVLPIISSAFPRSLFGSTRLPPDPSIFLQSHVAPLALPSPYSSIWRRLPLLPGHTTSGRLREGWKLFCGPREIGSRRSSGDRWPRLTFDGFIGKPK